MKIAIDARFWGPQGTGIGCYVEHLVRYLEKIDSENEYVILLRKSNYDLFQPHNPHFTKIVTDVSHYSLTEQLFMPRFLKKINPDLVHSAHFNIPVFSAYPLVVTIHDLIKHEFYSKSSTTRSLPLYWLKHKAYHYVFSTAVKKSRQVLVPSAYVKQQLIEMFKIPNSKITVTHEAAKDSYTSQRLSDEKLRNILARYDVCMPYIIYVGNVYPYKNLKLLLEAMQRIGAHADHKETLNLVVVCARSVFYERLKQQVETMGLHHMVNLVGYVPDADLLGLYQQAMAFITPSLSEGFGITGLEAMASGCPVISSHTSCLPEIYGDAALYFDPHNSVEIAEKILTLANDATMRNDYIRRGERQVMKYSWGKLAQETLQVYKKAVMA